MNRPGYSWKLIAGSAYIKLHFLHSSTVEKYILTVSLHISTHFTF